MQINLDSIETNPLEVVRISEETNIALADHARIQQSSMNKIIDDSAALREIQTEKDFAETQLDILAARQTDELLSMTENGLEQIKATTSAIEKTMLGKLQQAAEVADFLASGEGNFISKFQARRQFRKLDDQLNTLDITRKGIVDTKNNIRQRASQQQQIIQNQTAVKKQAIAQEDQILKAMRLSDKLEMQAQRLQANAELVKTLQQREKIDPNSAAGRQEMMRDVFEFMYFMRQGTSDGYNDSQSKSMGMIFDTLSPEQQRALQLGTSDFLKSKGTGVLLSPQEYVQWAMQKGDVANVEALATLTDDRDLLDTLALGKTQIFNDLYEQEIRQWQVTNEAALKRDPTMSISVQEDRMIQSRVAQQIAEMGARDVIGNVVGTMKQRINDTVAGSGGAIYRNVSAAPQELISPNLHSPKVIEFFGTDEVKDILAFPDQSDGMPLISTTARLIEAGRKIGKFSDVEIYSAVADFNSSAASAYYRSPDAMKAPREMSALRTMENYGVEMKPNLRVTVQKTGRRGGEDIVLDLANPADMQRMVEELSALRKRRERREVDRKFIDTVSNTPSYAPGALNLPR